MEDNMKQGNMKRQTPNPSPLGGVGEALKVVVDGVVQPPATAVGEVVEGIEGEAPVIGKRADGLVGSLVGLVGEELNKVVDDVNGLLTSVAASVDPENLRPQAGYEFQAPGPNDSRGPCPVS